MTVGTGSDGQIDIADPPLGNDGQIDIADPPLGNDGQIADPPFPAESLRVNASAAPRPPARQCVAVYVRHGDKDAEMPLVPFAGYATVIQEAAELLTTSLAAKQEAALAPLVDVFLGTEDPDVLADAKAWGLRHGTTVRYTTLVDRASTLIGNICYCARVC